MRLYLFFLFLICIHPSVYGLQDSLTVVPVQEIRYDSTATVSPIQFDRENIEELKQQKEFDYLTKVQNDSWWTRFKKWINLRYEQFKNWLFGDYQAHTLLALFLGMLPYLILLIIIGFIIWLFIRLNPGESILSQGEKPQVFYNEEEKIIQSQDISQLLKDAINNKNYRLAVRYYYLQLLKTLNEKEIISYQYQKTNAEYLAEVGDEKYRLPLKKVMRIYDFIWYGNFPVTEEDFRHMQQSFYSFQTILKSTRDHE